ncbi:GNAT family protein [Clostridium senegalense]
MMNKSALVDLVVAKGRNKEYTIKDRLGITIGRIYIIEIDEVNKNCLFRLKFYKENNSYEYMLDTLKIMLNILFNNHKVNKVNVLCSEELDTNAFTNIGFELEGILQDNIMNNCNKYEYELLFGITENMYKSHYINLGTSLKGGNIRLKVLTPQDSNDLLNYYMRNRKFLTPFEPHRDEGFYTIESQKQSLIESYKQFIKGESAHFGIYLKNKFIGRIRINNIVMGVFKNAFIGYSIDEEYQGKGYMKEAVKLAIEFAFKELGLHRIEASTMITNEKSQGVLKACGFEELGISKNYLYINGKWQDHKIFYKNNR